MSNKELATYVVKKSAIRKDGKIHRIGRKIDLDAEEAARLEEFLDPLDAGDEAEAGDELKTVITGLESKIEAAYAEIGERAATIISLQFQLGERDSTITSLNSQLANRESDLEELTSELKTLRETVASLELQLAEAPKEKTESKGKAEKGGKK